MLTNNCTFCNNQLAAYEMNNSVVYECFNCGKKEIKSLDIDKDKENKLKEQKK